MSNQCCDPMLSCAIPQLCCPTIRQEKSRISQSWGNVSFWLSSISFSVQLRQNPYMPTLYCNPLEICLSSSDWIAVWSGLGGVVAAAAAFFGAIIYEAKLRRDRVTQLKKHLRVTLSKMQTTVAPILDPQFAHSQFANPQQETEMWRQIIAARSAVRWALANPFFADDHAWVSVDLLDNIFDTYENQFGTALWRLSHDDHNWRSTHTRDLAIGSRGQVDLILEKL